MKILAKRMSQWDEIDTDSLLQLVNYRQVSTGFGYLLRHYWMPATQLTWQITTRQQLPGMKILEVTKWTEHRMLKCDADQCVWREKIRKLGSLNKYLIGFSRPRVDEYICTYNRSEQTFQSYHIHQFVPRPEQQYDARNEAFMQQPILTPLLPIPIGFTWHVRNEEGYMELTLESVKNIEGMTILFVRRKGMIVFNTLYLSGRSRSCPYRIYREDIPHIRWNVP